MSIVYWVLKIEYINFLVNADWVAGVKSQIRICFHESIQWFPNSNTCLICFLRKHEIPLAH